MTIKTKYISTKSKESSDNNRVLLSIGGDGAISFFHMKDAKAILLYPDQVKEMLAFLKSKKMHCSECGNEITDWEPDQIYIEREVPVCKKCFQLNSKKEMSKQ